ncbi:MAG: hypothetical protein ACLTSS_05005 [Phocaeicola coprocola]
MTRLLRAEVGGFPPLLIRQKNIRGKACYRLTDLAEGNDRSGGFF